MELFAKLTVVVLLSGICPEALFASDDPSLSGSPQPSSSLQQLHQKRCKLAVRDCAEQIGEILDILDIVMQQCLSDKVKRNMAIDNLTHILKKMEGTAKLMR